MVTVFPKGAGAQSEAVHRGDEGKGILSACMQLPARTGRPVATCFDLFHVCVWTAYLYCEVHNGHPMHFPPKINTNIS